MLMTAIDEILTNATLNASGRSREFEKGWAEQLLLHIKARGFAGSSPTLTVQLQSSPDKIVWDNIESSVTLTAAGQNIIPSTNFGRYVRVVYTLGDGSPVISGVDIKMQCKG